MSAGIGSVRMFASLLKGMVRHPRRFRAHWNLLHRMYFSHWRFDTAAPWKKDDTGFTARTYRSYDQYLEHQAHKFQYMPELARKFEERRATFRGFFQQRLGDQQGRSVLCLGSRDGVEVAALRDLGLLAIGIDLAYPDKSPYVHFGDFQHIPYPDGCFDYAYTNALDHAFDVERLLAEVRRVLRPETGRFVLDVHADGLAGGAYESMTWDSHEALVSFLTARGCLIVESRARGDIGMTQLLIGFAEKP